VSLLIGKLSGKVVEVIMNTLPVEITFVDEKDMVRYFNSHGKPIYPRPESALGRRVQECHSKSLPMVNRILEDFRAGRRDSVVFWADRDGRMIYTRYLAVRDGEGMYMGCLEVVEDVTDIRRIEGEKRVLDEL